MNTPQLPDHARARLQAKVREVFGTVPNDTPELAAVETTPQAELHREYVAFLEYRTERLKLASTLALYYLSLGDTRRVEQVLRNGGDE